MRVCMFVHVMSVWCAELRPWLCVFVLAASCV